MQPQQYWTPLKSQRPKDLNIEAQIPATPNRSLKTQDVARKLKSFDHFLYVWGTKGGYYLPPKSALTWHYISQVLAGEKLLLRIQQVGHVQELPKAKGFLVQDLWEECKAINEMHAYLPDVTPRTHAPRTYFYNVSLTRFSEW